ncbi:MAG: hypothetical protein IIX64_01635 [Bacteroidales bacterium]|nr:hypothetical protein [Bacteroidales bacterium]
MGKYPGVMVYLDISPAVKMLGDREAGQLFKAILEYAETRNVINLVGAAAFAFEIIRPRIDRDRISYEDTCQKRKYATYIRDARKNGFDVLSYEDWLSSLDAADNQVISNDIERHPTTTQLQLNSTTNNIMGVDKPPKSTRCKFIPPTVDEVQAYCEERKNGVDPQRFVDHYTANGWMVGKNKMKDWEAAVRTWEKNSDSKESLGDGIDFSKVL